MSYFNKATGLVLYFLALTACDNNKQTFSGELTLASQRAALPTAEHIALTVNKCWFKSRNTVFKPYRLAPELQSYSGKPRILLVAYNNPTERPLLVIEATGNPAQVTAYGPLMHTKLAGKIAENVKRWTAGDHKC